MNLVEATIAGDEVSFGQFRVALDPERRPCRARRVVPGIRPRELRRRALREPRPSDAGCRGQGAEELDPTRTSSSPSSTPSVAREVLEAEGEEDAPIASDGALLNARIDSRTRARVGASLGLVVDPARFHFDVETGASLPTQTVGGIDQLTMRTTIGCP